MRAKLNVVCFIRDNEGSRSFQIGSSYGVPSEEESVMFENAILNAIYKHISKKGMIFANGGSYDYRNIIDKLTIKDYWYEYFSENNIYSFKTITQDNKRFLVIRRKGKYYSKQRYGFTRANIKDEYEYG